MAHAANTRKRTRIQMEKEERILSAALTLFSAKGFLGTTLEEIATAAQMSKSNLIYYFPTKEEVYRSVLARTLDDWLEPLVSLNPIGEPIEEIRGYLIRKLDMARARPLESRLFANEILQGAPHVADVLAGPLKDLVDEKVAVIRRWIAEGRLAPHDPYHLIFAIWATTQHYADFDVQVRAVLGEGVDEEARFDGARRFLEDVVLRGLRAS